MIGPSNLYHPRKNTQSTCSKREYLQLANASGEGFFKGRLTTSSLQGGWNYSLQDAINISRTQSDKSLSTRYSKSGQAMVKRDQLILKVKIKLVFVFLWTLLQCTVKRISKLLQGIKMVGSLLMYLYNTF